MGWDGAWARLGWEGPVKRSAEVVCSGKEASGGWLCGDPLGPVGLTNAFEAVCSGKRAFISLLAGDPLGPVGHTLSLVGADGGVWGSTSTAINGSVLDMGERNSLGNAGVGLFLDMMCIPFYFTTTEWSARGDKRDGWDDDARSWVRTEPRPSTGEAFQRTRGAGTILPIIVPDDLVFCKLFAREKGIH